LNAARYSLEVQRFLSGSSVWFVERAREGKGSKRRPENQLVCTLILIAAARRREIISKWLASEEISGVLAF
jgi:hypothetical protein